MSEEDKQKATLGRRKSIFQLQNLGRVKELRRTFSGGTDQDNKSSGKHRTFEEQTLTTPKMSLSYRRASYDQGADSRVKNSTTHENILEELARHKPLSASDSQIEVDHGGSAKREGKGKRLKKTYKKLKEEVFTPVLERARRVSRTISRPFGEEWSSDEEDEEHDDPLAFFQSLHRSRKKSSLYSTDSEETDPSFKRYTCDDARVAVCPENRGRRKSAAGFFVSYATHRLHKIAGGPAEEGKTEWIYVEDAEQFENPRTGESFTPERAHISNLHPRELDYLRSLSLDRFNEKDTGTSAAMPKDPSRKLKRSSSFRGKKSLEKENHKLLAGGIFEVPLHVVLQIDAINGNRQSDPLMKCIRDKKRKNKEEPYSVIRSLTPRLGRRFGSLKARSISPISLSPRYQNEAADDSLAVPNNLVSRSFSTPSTPIDSRKLRPVTSASAIYNTDTPMIALNDLVNKLSNISGRDGHGSTSSLETDKNGNKLEVPQILQNCCEYILQNGLDQQGIFRVCGAKKQVRTLRAEFSTTSNMSIPSDTNVHVVAGLIKEFLKELPEALLTKTLYYPFIHCRRLEELDVRLEAYKELIRLLPGTNRDTLQFLLQFFKVVAENCEDTFDKDGLPIEGNLMDVSNLAVVIGPNILHRRKLGGNESKSQLANEAWEAPRVIEVVKELMENHNVLFTVESEVRKEVLRLMHDMKQSHFDDVMNRYNGVEEDSRGQQSPDMYNDSKARSRTDLSGSSMQLMNGSSGFVSGGCSINDSTESLQYKTCSTNKDECMMGYCERQHSSPELSTLKLGNPSHKRLSRSLDHDQTEDVSVSQGFQFDVDEPSTSSEEAVSKDSLYDLTPPSSPMFELRSNPRTMLCKAKPAKCSSLTGYGALSPNQTFTQFRLDKMTVGQSNTSRPAIPRSPRIGDSRRAAMTMLGNNISNNNCPAMKTYGENISRQSQV